MNDQRACAFITLVLERRSIVEQHAWQKIDRSINSTISVFDVGILSLEDPYARFITFNVTGENDTVGFCRILIPTALMHGTYRVLFNHTEVPSNLDAMFKQHTHIYTSTTHIQYKK